MIANAAPDKTPASAFHRIVVQKINKNVSISSYPPMFQKNFKSEEGASSNTVIPMIVVLNAKTHLGKL